MNGLAALLLLSLAPIRAAESPVVSGVRIRRLDIFDPAVAGEDRWLFRAANKLHVTTREEVVRRELLLKEGDPWDPLKALESERNLRANGRFRKVSVSSSARTDGGLDLDVLTQDSWTTQVQFSVGTEGGDHFVIYGAEEQNLLGYNKSVGFHHAQVGPKVFNILRYGDPRLLGSPFKLSALYVDSFRGESFGADLKRPFLSLDTPWAVQTSWSRFVKEDTLYLDAEEHSHFISNTHRVQAGAGLRLPWDRPLTQRAQAGWYSERSYFTPEIDTRGLLPHDRELSGPTLGYSWVVPRYVKLVNVDRIERDEDFTLGNELRLLAGWTGAATGSDRDRLVYRASNQQGFELGAGRLLIAQVAASGRAARGRVENGLVSANVNLIWKSERWLPQTWVAHAEFSQGTRLDGENQILLGGNNGLRGYRNYSFQGSRSLLLNLEDRLFIPREFFHLLRVGGVVFFDAGSVVPEHGAFSWARLRSDVGVGLRLSPTRSTGGRVMRIDAAYALNKGPGPDRFVFAARGGQAFDLFSSATRGVRQSPASRLEDNAPTEFPRLH